MRWKKVESHCSWGILWWAEMTSPGIPFTLHLCQEVLRKNRASTWKLRQILKVMRLDVVLLTALLAKEPVFFFFFVTSDRGDSIAAAVCLWLPWKCTFSYAFGEQLSSGVPSTFLSWGKFRGRLGGRIMAWLMQLYSGLQLSTCLPPSLFIVTSFALRTSASLGGFPRVQPKSSFPSLSSW